MPYRDKRSEALAKYAHEAWSGWMKYMFQFILDEHLQPQAIAYDRDTGRALNAMIVWGDNAQEKIDRWRRQMNTTYELLPEPEKRSDRAEAEKILKIMCSFYDRERAAHHFAIDVLTKLVDSLTRGVEAPKDECQARSGKPR